MSALKQSRLDFNQGADFWKGWTWYTEDESGVRTGRDLSGWTAKMQVRRIKTSETVLAEATNVDNAGTKIDLDAEGNVDLYVSHVMTEGFNDWKDGVFDLELVAPDGKVTRFVEGSASNSFEVTR